MQVTGTLRQWFKSEVYNIYWGKLHGDAKGRWEDGTHIHTSDVREVIDKGDHFLVLTMNSVYILPKDEELKYDLG